MFTVNRGGLILAIAVGTFAICTDAINGQDLHGWSTRSQSAAVALAGVEQSQTVTRFTLKNISAKPILGIAVTTPNKETHFLYWLDGTDLAPQAVRALSVPASASQAAERVLDIVAVVYSDGTAEGSPAQIEDIRGTWLGYVLETERVTHILASIPAGQNVSDDTISVLAGRVGRTMPASAEEAIDALRGARQMSPQAEAYLHTGPPQFRSGFLAGVRFGRESALRQIDSLTALSPSSGTPPLQEGRRQSRPSRLMRLQQQYSERSQKLQQRLASVVGGIIQ